MFEREDRGTLIVANDFDGRGGLRRVRDLADALAERRRVTVLTWAASLRVEVERKHERLTIIRLPAPAPVTLRDDRPVLARINLLCSTLTGIVAATLLWRRWSTVLGVKLSPEGIVARVAGEFLGKRVVLSEWASGPAGPSRRINRLLLRRLWRPLLSGADAYVVQASVIADELVDIGVPLERIHVVPNSVDLEAYSPVDERMRLRMKRHFGLGDGCHALYLGRLSLRQKRLDLLLDAWGQARLSGWQLVLAGDGPDKARVAEMANRLEPPPLFVGWQEEATRILSAADLFVLPSDWEGMSGSLVQAMAFGLPGVASRITAFEQMRPSGVVLAANDAGSWASVLEQVTGDQERRHLMGHQARRWVEQRCDARRVFSAYSSLLAA